jgi:hypothetical protein
MQMAPGYTVYYEKNAIIHIFWRKDIHTTIYINPGKGALLDNAQGMPAL